MNTIINKAKSLAIYAAASIIGAGSLVSCSDFLEIEPQGEVTLEQFWNEKKDVENIVAGCYSALSSYGALSRMMIWGEFRAENIVNNGVIQDDVNLERLLKENITASNVYTTWGDFYSVINRCNTVMKYAPQVAANDPSYTQSQLEAHIAEVTALRSLCYFYLIRTFRDVPYSEEAYLDDDQILDLPATKFDELLSKLIASLEEVKGNALTKYPEVNTTKYWDYNRNRVTKDFVNALLCEMYLWQKNYDKCIEYADLIIKSKKKDALEERMTESDFIYFNGYPLIASRSKGTNIYGNAFSEIFANNNSMESIFELNFRKDDRNGSQLCNGPVSNFFGGQGRTPFVVATTFVGQDQSDKLYNVFSSENAGYDGRAYENILVSTSGTPVYINKYSTQGGVWLSNSNEAYKTAVYTTQYPTYGDKHDSRNKSNYIIYRLTDIMLLKAEALVLKIQEEGAIAEGTPDYELYSQAFELVDAVNKRSLLEPTPYTHVLDITKHATKLGALNLVYDERQRELMFEGKRYFDLVRRALREDNTDYLANHVSNKNASTAAIVRSKMQKIDAIFWPYNLDETKCNKNLVQNPAFGSGENSSYEKTN